MPSPLPRLAAPLGLLRPIASSLLVALAASAAAIVVGCQAAPRDEASGGGPAIGPDPARVEGAGAGEEAPAPAGQEAEALAEPQADPAEALLDPGSTGPTEPAGLEDTMPGETDGCPVGMVRVEGEYCPAVIQECLEHHPEYVRDRGKRKSVSERCLRYKAPSRCAVKSRVKMAFCMDRFEYPNEVGEIPQVLTSWHEASAACAAEGKRLCTEDEFNFACEGPEMLPYAYGYDRDAGKCNQDQEYRFPDHSRVLPPYERCLETPWCQEELARLDQRKKIGENPECVSWAGVYDLNGNVNEWVRMPDGKAPYRSGLKGGWWGPIRSRCRPTTTFHKEDDYGYESGFRCCADTAG